ncbi:uncharacterized protein LOC143896814 isoform X2 [Temnothorax americanus]|uniref:uncharacterized protein LOC143896814 isoform X2 n=1 Tax=Temnothorax americanus TaxID=1964332 RepID=UPI0040681147
MLSPTPPIDRSSLRPGTGYLIAPRVPHGLATVVESLTREVLRHRPEDIYVFAARHFEKLLKLREEYHAEEYSDREFNHEFSRDFNLWPRKETQRRLSNGGWSLEKEIEIFERREQVLVDVEESQEDVSTGRENRKALKQTCSRDPTTAKKTSKKSKDNETTSDVRTTRIISQMTALHGSGKNIQTKDIKQELRKNKLSGEKSKATDSVEKGIRGDRRSKTKVSKKDKNSEEEVERATTTSSSRTSARRPLKKVRRIETESETETEQEVAAKTGLENGHARSTVKNDGASRETIARTGSKERRPDARLSEHSSERKVSSRALSMDRIRAYVLRKFASTASLEVLRSPTYVEQVQEVIDRAAPIIKEKLEEIGQPRGKRSRSVDLAWNGESFHRHVREERRYGAEEESRRGKSGNGLERKANIVRKEEVEDSFGRDETILNAEREGKKLRRRSAGSGKRSRRRESGDFGVVDQVDDNSKHGNKLEHESGATRDTLEARLTATQSILEDISKSTSELGGARRSDPAGSDPSESEFSGDHANGVSLPVVRPRSSRNSRSASNNGSDNLTLPPISPEAPKSTKKRNELSLPVLPTASNNGNHSARKPQEQDISRDAEEASTMHDITSDMEDIAVLPVNEDAIVDAKQDSGNVRQDLTSDVRFINDEERMRDEDALVKLDEKRGSLEEFEELEELEEGRRSEEVFRDSLNVTPEVANMVPLRPDSLEPDEDEVKLQDDNADPARENTFDRLKDKLIEIEMAERSIEKALACQQVVTCDVGEMTSQVEKSVTDGKINEAKEPTNEAEEAVSEIRKSTDVEKIPINKDDEKRKKNNDDEKRTDDIEKIKDVTETSNKTEDLNIEERLTNKKEKMKSEIKEPTNKTENSRNKVETLANGIKKLATGNEEENLKNKAKVLKNGVEKTTDQTEIMIKATENEIKAQDGRSMDKTEKSMNEKLSNGNQIVEELAVKVHVKNVQSINPRSHSKDSQITEVVETDGDNTTTSKKEAENADANGFSKGTTSGNTTVKSECPLTNLPSENSRTKARKKRESDKLPVTMPLSLEVPYSYVLSEGSPCEIPDFVTTVIIPDRPCPSPVTLEDEDYQLEPTSRKEESLTRFDMAKEISKDERREEDQHRSVMEVFGEYIRPEPAVLPVDTDFMRGVKKPSQDIMIAHQDLDKIREEAEEEEEKEDGERKETESHQERKNDKETVKEEEIKKVVMLEDIVEHEETEETDARTIGSKDAEEISSPGILEYESLSDTKDLTVDTGVTNEGRAEVTVELSAPENSSEESGSTQGTHTTTSSDVKESTAESNRSIESPSPGRPVVPELNLDSLQDNTVSSFKITENGTLKEDNGSPRESDATTSLIEPLISDERLVNRLASGDHEEEIVAEELTESGLQSEIPEADQLYRAEHAEYEWLGKDPLSTEINLEDEPRSQKDSIGLRASSEDAAQIGSLLREKGEAEELGSEEEIARELIDLLDKDVQFRTEKLDLKKGSGKSEKSNLDVDDESNRLLSESMHSMSVEREKKDHEDSLDKIDNVMRTEATSELSGNVVDTNQNNKDKKSPMMNEEIEKIKPEVAEEARAENSQVAPLAQFEQELLEENNRLGTTDEKITVRSKPDIINIDRTDIQEKLEEKQASVEELPERQSSKIEEPNRNREKVEQEELQSQEKYEQEKLEVHEEYEQKKLETHEECKQEKLHVQEEIEQEKLHVQEKIEQEKLHVQEEIEQKKLKIESKCDEENVKEKMEEEIVGVTAVPLEVTESRKNSLNESMKHDNGHEETEPNTRGESIIDERTGKDAENEKEEKTEDLSGKIERLKSVHGPITSAISEQSVECRSRFGYWTTETKSSTVETVIEASDSNTSTDERMEIVADVPEIVADESFIRKKDDFHSAVVKIQACIRGFLTRRRERRSLRSELVSNNVPSTQTTVTSGRLEVPQDTLSLREARRLRREEALRNTTLSLENAFATGRLQHTGEFHDSVPLFPFDLTNSKINSVTSNDSSDEEIDVEEANPPDTTKSSANGGDPAVGGAKPMDFLQILGYPRDDENQYLNFITSVEDLGSNMDSLPLDDDNTMKSTKKSTDDARPSTTSGEGSLREPLALPGDSQGVVIEELTSLDDPVPSDSMKPSTAPKTSLDTNSSMPSEECALEDAKNDLGMSPRATSATGDREQGAEGQESAPNSESVGVSDLRSEDANKKSNEISRERMEEEKDDKT